MTTVDSGDTLAGAAATPTAASEPPTTRSPVRRFALTVLTAMAVGIAVGGGAGYLSRDGEVNHLHRNLSVVRADASKTHAKLSDTRSSLSGVQGQLSSTQDSVTACQDAVNADSNAMFWLMQAVSDRNNDDYWSALDDLNHVHMSRVTALENGCTNASSGYGL